MTEKMNQYFGLIQPRGMGGRITRTPPGGCFSQIRLGSSRGMAGVPIVDQKDAFQVAVPLPELFQGLDIVLGVFGLQDNRFHQARVNHQEHQDSDGAMAFVLKFFDLYD